ncbi:hypothetical protein T10_53 [Trichinella papuae]|uniref:Uncharacterized protein n=1 Tax=Trichinella papuae TaxID=268474 RepID=A0A0V1M2N1_9BILA|nr:hypothetical protein T10_53 [Trichinella papuae]
MYRGNISGDEYLVWEESGTMIEFEKNRCHPTSEINNIIEDYKTGYSIGMCAVLVFNYLHACIAFCAGVVGKTRPPARHGEPVNQT